MKTVAVRAKQTKASIRLPKRPKANKRVSTRSTRRTVTTRTSQNSVAATANTRQASAAKATGYKPKTSFHVLQVERMLFLILLLMIIVSSSIYVGVKVQARSAGFEMSELKKTQLANMKEREELMKRITTHKRPGTIEKRARQRGMVTPTSKQVIKLP